MSNLVPGAIIVQVMGESTHAQLDILALDLVLETLVLALECVQQGIIVHVVVSSLDATRAGKNRRNIVPRARLGLHKQPKVSMRQRTSMTWI